MVRTIVIPLPLDLRLYLDVHGVELGDVLDWRHHGQNRYLVDLKDGRQLHVTIARNGERGRYWGD